MPPPAFSAILLAAGYSTRMGRDKALLEVDGAPLWQRQRDVLVRAGAAEIFISARPDQTWARSAPGFAAVLHDAVPNRGPLAGLAAGLERATHAHLAVLAVDLPRMMPAWFTALLGDCAPGLGAAGRQGTGKKFFEPLAAIYSRATMPLVSAALARGELSLQSLLAGAVAQRLMGVREIAAEEKGWFENWNEPPPGPR